eukprot:m.981840 g.981840  ORF g.981840 m.981840 type:complete len:65 (+) comp23972_c0_seq45:1485-1679(+)
MQIVDEHHTLDLVAEVAARTCGNILSCRSPFINPWRSSPVFTHKIGLSQAIPTCNASYTGSVCW